MANWPSYDPARLGQPTGSKERFTDFNPNYMAALEPGSTFKILTLALALEKGVVNSTDVVRCGGSLKSGRTEASGATCTGDAGAWNRGPGKGDLEKLQRQRGDLGAPSGFARLHRVLGQIGAYA